MDLSKDKLPNDIMPIKKKNFELYPPDWRKISWWIINIRAQNRCEGCGAENKMPHPETGKKVVLSVAHLDHNPQNSDQDLPTDAPLEKSNMRAFCQRCHNRWDREHRNESIKDTYKGKHLIAEAKETVKETEAGFPQQEMDHVMNEVVRKMQDEVREEQSLEALQQVLQRLLQLMPAKDSIDHAILAKSLELQGEYLLILSMDNKEVATPQVQAKLTVLRSKMGIIDQLKSLSKTKHETIQKLKGQVIEVEAEEEVPSEDFMVRGYGIRYNIKSRRNGSTNPD